MSPRRKDTLAARADAMALYQTTVQQPDEDVKLFRKIFRRAYGRRPVSLREDFCGAAAVSCAWVRSAPDRTARAIDLEESVLVWGALHNREALPEAARARLQLVQADVLDVVTPRADLVAAQNFSFFTFRDRRTLVRYFRAARRALRPEGALVLDVLGGHENVRGDAREVRRAGSGVRYVWEQEGFDPIHQRARYGIHFRFRDGSEMRDAFRYDWRLWSIPETREALEDAGFRRTEVWWEDDDGVWRPREAAPPHAVWLAVVVGLR